MKNNYHKRALRWLIVSFAITLLFACDSEKADIERGHRAFDRGHFANAINDYSLAIKDNPKNPNSYFFRGFAKMKNGDFDGAVDDFSKAIQLDPNYFKAYINRGTILKQEEELDEALFDYNKAIELEPDDFRAYLARADIWFQKKSFDNAISDYSIFIKNDPRSSMAYRGLGDAYYHKKCYQDSIKNYLKSIELNQNDSFAYNNLAWIFSTCVEDKYRDGEKALRYSQKAVDLDPSPYNLSTLAAAYAENNQFKKAAEILERIINNEKVNNKFKAKLENYLVLFKKHQQIRELPEM